VAQEEGRTIWINRLFRIALILLILSIFIPWWTAWWSEDWNYTDESSDTIMVGSFVYPEPTLNILAPGWSSFLLSPLGTKLTLHFQKLLILLVGSIILLGISWFLLKRRQSISKISIWGSVAFCGSGIVFFSIFFPRVIYAGRTFWPWGSLEVQSSSPKLILNWSAHSGYFLAICAFVVLIIIARQLTFIIPRQNTTPTVNKDKSSSFRFSNQSNKKFTAIFVSWILITMAIWAGLSHSPRISTEALINDFNWSSEFKSFESGDHAIVTGKVTSITLIPTSYGDYTFLGLDGNDNLFSLKGDWNSRIRIGDMISIPIHFKEYSYNRIEHIWSEEAIAPFPSIYSIFVVFKSVSFTAGAIIIPDDTTPNEPRLKVLIPHDFTLDSFNISLVKVEGPFYLGESSALGCIETPYNTRDGMIPLRSGLSDNGTFSFTDANGNNILDWNDTIELFLPSTTNNMFFESYILNLCGPVIGVAYIVVSDNGPLLFYEPEFGRSESYYYLAMPPDQINGNSCSSEVEILNKFGTNINPSEFSFKVWESNHMPSDEIPAETAGINIDGVGHIRFRDNGIHGVLDKGDKWIFENLKNNSLYYFVLFSEQSGNYVSRVEWVCGLGTNIARYPRVNFSTPYQDPNISQDYYINVTSVDWFPVGLLNDYDVVLFKNDTVLLSSYEAHKSLDEFPIGPSYDGANTWLSFNDTNRNGYFSAGDQFILNNTATQSRYELKLFHGRHQLVGSISWTT